MSAGNVTLALAVATGGAVLAWAGITDPPGGLPGAIQRIINGQPAAPAKAASNVLDYTNALYTPSTSSGGSTGTVALAGGSGAAIVAEARKHIGAPYQWGAAGPSRFDCSGLVTYVFKRLGVTLPHLAAAQATSAGTAISEAQAGAGDLVFFGHPAFHVGIISGPGVMIAAPQPGGVVSEGPYAWGRAFGLSFRRVTLPSQPTVSYSA